MLNVSVTGQQLVIKTLDEIRSPALRKKIVNKAARALMKAAKDRATQQTTLTGQAFGPYSNNTQHTRPRRRKMLTRLARRLAVLDLTHDSATVGWGNRYETTLAAKHHYGYSQNITPKQLANDARQPQGQDAPATRQQAKALLAMGYKVRRKGKGHWTPSLKWLVQNLTIGRAGLLLRLMRGGSKSSWQTTLPPRPFLGVTDADLETVNDIYHAELAKALQPVAS